MSKHSLVPAIEVIVGERNCLTKPRQTERFRKGFRSGEGDAAMVILPGTLLEMWKVLQLVVAADCIVIMQAANTGLTEGSTPSGSYDRDVVIISTLRLNRLHVLDEGRQVISHPGGTLFELEKLLRPYGREPHSVIGSSCIGASIVGGVCNNSGGALVRRGPVYTELALYAQLTAAGELALVNHLGIELGDTPDDILGRLDRGEIDPASISHATGRASNGGYGERLRAIDADTPARYNADPTGLFEASGSAGKVAVFAVRLDTFPADKGAKVYYIGTDNTAALTRLRRRLLTELPELPISGEYLHRDCFDLTHRYGKDVLMMIHWLGTDRLPGFFALKGAIDARLEKMKFLPRNLTDRFMQMLSGLLPEALPKRLMNFRKRFEHHLILKVPASVFGQTETLLTDSVGSDGWFACDETETKKAMLHRFAAAGAAIRYGAVRPDLVEGILSLDIALRRNDNDWFEQLPAELDAQIGKRIYYGHFLCHVLHQDYAVKKGCDPSALKRAMLRILDTRGAKYPAEHNVGHVYAAEQPLADHYAALDPTNSFNPGVGKMSKFSYYGCSCGCNEHPDANEAVFLQA